MSDTRVAREALLLELRRSRAVRESRREAAIATAEEEHQ
jgi:hypothetical protein